MDVQIYDYIVIGAGSAGCVIASRLTEDRNVSVLLLEAGPADRSWRIDMPSAVGSLIASDRFNWAYISDPEPHLGGRRLSHPRGRVIGGSSSINGMVYIRGHALDYDTWAQMGLKGWGYADVLPYFKRAEGHLLGEDAYHGADGPLAVHAPDLKQSPLVEAFLAAAAEAGYALSSDVNGERQEGFGRIDRTTKGGRRWSAARAYLDPARGRPNLKIITGALVRRIIVRGGDAEGVVYDLDGKAGCAHARGEVILCAGAINSPQLLQLSGIGAADRLAKIGIEPVCDLPAVGEYLNDHPDIVVQHRCLQPVSIYNIAHGLGRIATGLRWFAGGHGPAGSNHFEAGGFIRSRAGLEQPDLQLTFMPLAIESGTVYDVGTHSFQVHIDLMRPKSLGYVRAQSPDPTAAPAICFNYLADLDDRAVLRHSVRLTREILTQAALAPYADEEINPGSGISSDDEIDAWITRNLETCYHPVGTCRMGRDRVSSVVDDACRVHGVSRLRVIDASVMPAIVSGNTNAPTIMIAEKVSDLLRSKTPLAAIHVPTWIHPSFEMAQR